VAKKTDKIEAVLFDFGGVIAEEGFREGLRAIARSNGLDPNHFYHTATRVAYETGYVIGAAEERTFWDSLREKTGISGSDNDLRHEILSRFIMRPWMIQIVRSVRGRVPNVSILSDQTNWLDELNDQHDFFKEFDQVFNSYHVGKGKNDPSLFSDITRTLGVQPESVIFIDDNEGHVERARAQGLKTILFRDREHLLPELERRLSRT
jgi:putative hydrolase of the HAD superfamily